MGQRGEWGSFPCSFPCSAADWCGHGLVVEHSHSSAFFGTKGSIASAHLWEDWGDGCFPVTLRLTGLGALPDSWDTARSPFQVLCSGRRGFAVTRGCFFPPLLKHPGVPRGILDYKTPSSLALHGGLLAWILINHALIHGKRGFFLKPSPSCCCVLSSSEVLLQLWVCLHAEVIFPCVFYLLPRSIMKFN